MNTKMLTAVVALLGLGTPLVAQQGPPPGQPPVQQEHALRMQRTQEALQQMDGLMQRLRETSQWMQQHGAQQGLREMGQQMEQAGDRLRQMLRQMDQLHRDPAMQQDRDRLREMDKLQDRLRTMTRDLDEAHQSLRRVAGA